jgi:hypothetical protein
VTFDAHHYVPVLKVKRGEKAALSLLSATVRAKVTPLLEIVERTDKELGPHLDTAFKGLADAARGFKRCFLDAREIASDGSAAAAEVFRRAASSGIVFTPVTGISRTAADVAAALGNRARGLALRLRREEFEAGGFGMNVRTFLDKHGLAPQEIDLIIDLGAVDDMVAMGVENLARAFLADVPDHTRWKTFTISACAFPLSMGGVDRHSHDLTKRADWLAWQDGLYADRNKLPRLPTFSDGVIQHPKGVEGFDPRTMQVSASIRYTAGDSWLLIKGESTRLTLPSTQFPSLATQLVYGHLRRWFCGVGHCAGCRFIKAAADGASGFGSAEAWRRLGTIHHITTVVQELGALPWP